MEYSEIVTLTENGFQISDKLLHPVGIYDNSRCWGAILENVGKIIKNEIPGHSEKHILLSPIPYNSWGSLIRIQARVKDEPASLSLLLGAIDNFGKGIEPFQTPNVIAISGVTTGYYNARLHILTESSDLRNESEKIRKSIVQNKITETSIYSSKVFERVINIRKHIHLEDEKKGFLYKSNDVQSYNYLWDEDIINEQFNSNIKNKHSNITIEEFQEQIGKSKVLNLSCEWLHTHALSYLYSKENQPFRFDYDLEEGLLKSSYDVESSIKSITHKLDLDLPALFLANFNPLSKYIRLVPLQRERLAKSLVKIRYKYECRSIDRNKDISICGSNGLLHHITSLLANNTSLKVDERPQNRYNFDIKNITSYSKRFSRRSEEGAVEIFSVVNSTNRVPSLDDVIEDVTNRIGNFQAETSKETHFTKTINVSTKSPFRIFLSCREEIKLDKWFMKILSKVSTKYGIDIEYSDKHADVVTTDVLSRLSSVDGLIAIYSITEIEQNDYMHTQDKSKFHPNLGWLLFEYGIAMGKNIPVVMLRDNTVVTTEQWGQWINVGKDSSQNFIDRKKHDELEQRLEGAVLAILKKLSTKSQDHISK